MELIVIRHAIAYERDSARWPDDDERPLTGAGRKRFELAARGLREVLRPPQQLLSSSLARAQQTAAILEREAKFPQATEIEELAPGIDTGALIAALKRHRAERLAIVGHEPALSALIAALIRGTQARGVVRLKKGAVAHLDCGKRIERGKAELIALLPPRVLRAIHGK